MNTEIELIKIIIKRMAGKEPKGVEALLPLLNCERLKKLLAYHDLTSFAYLALRDFDALIPRDFKVFLENNYYYAMKRCIVFQQEFLRIFDAFGEGGVTILPFKGIALLYDVYLDNPVRPMVDIDILIKDEDVDKAKKIFCGLGYEESLYGLEEEYWRNDQIHLSFSGGKNNNLPLVELHWLLDFKKRYPVLPRLWDRIKKVNVDGRAIELLSPEDTFFSLALHSRRFGKTLCLKGAYDGALILNKYGSNFDWDYILREARKGKMRMCTFFLLSQINLIYTGCIPRAIWRDLGVSVYKRKLIQHFINKNTFLVPLGAEMKELYLKSHFLLYDSFWEAAECIINIPKERFAKYYGLDAYSIKTGFLYQIRLFYIFIKEFQKLFKGVDKNIAGKIV